MKRLTLLLLITGLLFTPSCGQFHLSGDRTGRDEDFDLTPIHGEDISAALSDMSNCAEYESYNPFRFISTVINLRNIVIKVENCISKGLDRSVAIICLEEQKLKEMKRRYRDNDEALDQIDEYEAYLENVKAEVENQLYEIADRIYDLERKIERHVERRFDSDSFFDFLGETLGIMTVDSEVGGFRRLIEHKARNLCGYKFFSSRRDDHRRRD